MSYIYLPRSHRFRAFNKNSRINFTQLYLSRKYSLNELQKLINCVLLFVFLIIALRMGTISVLMFTNIGSIYATSQSDGLHLPCIDNYNRYHGSTRHFLYISIHKDGIIKIDGYEMEKNTWTEYFYNKRIWDPQIVACLLVDRNCTMDIVKEVIFKLRKGQIYRFWYSRFFS